MQEKSASISSHHSVGNLHRDSTFGNLRGPSMFARVKEQYNARQEELFGDSTRNAAAGNRAHANNSVQAKPPSGAGATRNNQSLLTQPHTMGAESINENLRASNMVVGGSNSSMMTFDSINVRKTTHLGVRSSGFFPSQQKEEQPT